MLTAHLALMLPFHRPNWAVYAFGQLHVSGHSCEEASLPWGFGPHASEMRLPFASSFLSSSARFLQLSSLSEAFFVTDEPQWLRCFFSLLQETEQMPFGPNPGCQGLQNNMISHQQQQQRPSEGNREECSYGQISQMQVACVNCFQGSLLGSVIWVVSCHCKSIHCLPSPPSV